MRMPSLSSLVDYSNPHSVGSRVRRRRRYHLEGLIECIYKRRGSVRILDLGGRRHYWKLFDDSYLSDRRVHVTLLNHACEPINANRDEPAFSAVSGDGCNLSQYQDNTFDLTHSNSTIEHVGTWERMEAFARETRRLAPAYYLQTGDQEHPSWILRHPQYRQNALSNTTSLPE
jgi:Methyltransferase domain